MGEIEAFLFILLGEALETAPQVWYPQLLYPLYFLHEKKEGKQESPG